MLRPRQLRRRSLPLSGSFSALPGASSSPCWGSSSAFHFTCAGMFIKVCLLVYVSCMCPCVGCRAPPSAPFSLSPFLPLSERSVVWPLGHCIDCQMTRLCIINAELTGGGGCSQHYECWPPQYQSDGRTRRLFGCEAGPEPCALCSVFLQLVQCAAACCVQQCPYEH